MNRFFVYLFLSMLPLAAPAQNWSTVQNIAANALSCTSETARAQAAEAMLVPKTTIFAINGQSGTLATNNNFTVSTLTQTGDVQAIAAEVMSTGTAYHAMSASVATTVSEAQSNQFALRSWVVGFSNAPATYNSTLQTIDVNFSDGTTGQMFEEMWEVIKNTAGAPISNGVVVRTSSASGELSGAKLASCTDTWDEAIGVIGLSTMTTPIPINGIGKITTQGNVNDLDTSMFEEGSNLWVSVTPGQLTMTKPTGDGHHQILIGQCLRKHANAGRIYVHVHTIPRPEDIDAVGTNDFRYTHSLTNASAFATSAQGIAATNAQARVDVVETNAATQAQLATVANTATQAQATATQALTQYVGSVVAATAGVAYASQLDGYATTGALSIVANTATQAQTVATGHVARTDNPHATTAAQVGAISNTAAGIAAANILTNNNASSVSLQRNITIAGMAGIGTTNTSYVGYDAKLLISGDGAGVPGRTLFSVNNTSPDSAAAFNLFNSSGKGIGVQASGSSYVAGEAASVWSVDLDLMFTADGNTESGGPHVIKFTTGGWANSPALTLLPGNPGNLVAGGSITATNGLYWGANAVLTNLPATFTGGVVATSGNVLTNGGSGASLTGITAAQVGAVATNDARYLSALTNVPTLAQVSAAGNLFASGPFAAELGLGVGALGNYPSSAFRFDYKQDYTSSYKVLYVDSTGVFRGSDAAYFMMATGGVSDGSSLTGITAAQVGAVSTGDVRYLSALTNAAAFDVAGAAASVSNWAGSAITAATQGLVTASITNGLASVASVVSATSGVAYASQLTGYVSTNDTRYLSALTNEPIAIDVSNRLYASAITNNNAGVVNFTNSLFAASCGPTNGLVNQGYQFAVNMHTNYAANFWVKANGSVGNPNWYVDGSGNDYATSFRGNGQYLTGITASQVGAVPTNDARYLATLTNGGPVAVAATNAVQRSGDTMSGSLYTTAPTALSGAAPAQSELVTAGWVRNLIGNSGQSFYNSSNVMVAAWSGTNYGYQASTQALVFSRTYTAPTNGEYIGFASTTNAQAYLGGSTIAVDVWLSRQGGSGGGIAASVSAEIYFAYDTNTVKAALMGDIETQAQAVTTGTNLYQWVVSIPPQAFTGNVYIIRAFRASGMGGTTRPNIVVVGGDGYASRILVNGLAAGQGYVYEAPQNGTNYVRRNAQWVADPALTNAAAFDAAGTAASVSNWTSNTIADIVDRITGDEVWLANGLFYSTCVSAMGAMQMSGHVFDGFDDVTGLAGGSNFAWAVGGVTWSSTLFTPKLHYKLNDAAGTNAVETISGNNATGALNTVVSGKISNAFSITNGVASGLCSTGLMGFASATNFTLCAWVWWVSNASAGQYSILQNNISAMADEAIFLGLKNSGAIWGMARGSYGSTPPYTVIGSSIPTATWTHVALTYDGNNLRTYINSVTNVYGTGGAGSTGTWRDRALIIGKTSQADNNNAFNFSGYIDDARAYTQVLSQAQIQLVYASAAGTEADTLGGNMTVTSKVYGVTSHVPRSGVLRMLVSDPGLTLTNNTDVIGYISRDAGTNYTQVFFRDQGLLYGMYQTNRVWASDQTNYVGGAVQSNVTWKVSTFNGKSATIKAVDYSTQQ